MSEDVMEFFDALRSAGLSESSLEATVRATEAHRLQATIERCNELIPTPKPAEDARFQFIANTSLSGGPLPCTRWECRRGNLDAAARFAALFAECVYIRNPFEAHLFAEPSEMGKVRLIGDLRAMWLARPLIEAGLFSFAKTDIHLCMSCYAENRTNITDWENRAEEISLMLEEDYARDTSMTVERVSPTTFLVTVWGPETLIPHGSSARLVQSIPDEIAGKVGSDGPYRLTAEEAVASGFHQRSIANQLCDLFTQGWYSHAYGCSYVTNHSLDLHIAELFNKATGSQSAEALIQGMAHAVPVVLNAPLDRLVALRRADEASFSVYRDAMSRILSDSTLVGAAEVREAVQDLLVPELNELRHRIRNSRRALLDGLREELVFGAGFVAVGLTSGIVSKDIAQILAALGGIKYTGGILGKVNQLLREPEPARASKWHFLWKLEQTA